MKRNDIFIVTGTVAYSYLFYNQTAGLNFLLFNLLVVLLLYLKERSLPLHLSWLVAAAGSIISGFFIFWWGTPLPVLANICSLLALAGLSFDPDSSLLFAAFNTYASIFISIPQLFNSVKRQNQPHDGRASILKRILLLIIPAIAALFFIGIYYTANPIFAKFIDKVNFDFISVNWILFTLAGFFMMFGVFNIYRLSVNNRDKNTPDILHTITTEEHMATYWATMLSAQSELWMGEALFALLNLVLLTVNGLDVYYMWIVNLLPDGVTIAEFLHDSTDALILSILMAIAVMLFVFRGYLNFIENNKWLKALAYTWVAQNILLVITTANTNWWIIQSSGLTRRRIGVYVYLLLCIIGLVTTCLKVAQSKSNWFLFRKNAWAFYVVFIVSCFFNWDDMIVNYNCKNFKSLQLDYIDRDYQTDLSYTCLSSLYKYYAAEKGELNPAKQIFTDRVVYAMNANYQQLKKDEEASAWQSYCFTKHKNFTEINEIMNSGALPKK